MNNKIGILIPTRQRLDDFIKFADSWVNTTKKLSDVIVRIDIDDNTYDDIIDKYPFIWEIGERKPFLHCLNEIANKYVDQYDYLGFMEDDCLFITEDWENVFIDKLKDLGKNGIVWGNDCVNTDTLIGLPFMDSSIVKRLGYMSPPELLHLWADHFWKKIGVDLGKSYYFPDVIVEHRHYSTGKRQKDQISEHVDNVGNQDYYNYQNYVSQRYHTDLSKLST